MNKYLHRTLVALILGVVAFGFLGPKQAGGPSYRPPTSAPPATVTPPNYLTLLTVTPTPLTVPSIDDIDESGTTCGKTAHEDCGCP